MDNSVYIALAKQVSSFNNLNIIANNIAQTNTTGYRTDRMIFQKYLHQDINEKISLPNDVATITNFQEGSLNPTHRALDVAISGSGFFLIKTPLGIRYTRNGNFQVNENNALVDINGNFVLSSDGQDIVFEEGDGQPIILENGSILVGESERGVIGVVDFKSHYLLKKSVNGYFTSEVPHIVIDEPKIVQGSLENSNVNSILELTRLIEVQREVAQTSNLISDILNMQRSTYKIFSKSGA